MSQKTSSWSSTCFRTPLDIVSVDYVHPLGKLLHGGGFYHPVWRELIARSNTVYDSNARAETVVDFFQPSKILRVDAYDELILARENRYRIMFSSTLVRVNKRIPWMTLSLEASWYPRKRNDERSSRWILGSWSGSTHNLLADAASWIANELGKRRIESCDRVLSESRWCASKVKKMIVAYRVENELISQSSTS